MFYSQEHEREKAKLKAKLVEVDQIAESHQRFKSSKALLSLQLKEAEMGLQEQKQREEYISYRHAEQVRLPTHPSVISFILINYT